MRTNARRSYPCKVRSDGTASTATLSPPSCTNVPQYRTTVSKMLRRQADESRNPAQFIVTTFHPQVRAAWRGTGQMERGGRVISSSQRRGTIFLAAGCGHRALYTPPRPCLCPHLKCECPHRLLARPISCTACPTPTASAASTPSGGRMRSPSCR